MQSMDPQQFLKHGILSGNVKLWRKHTKTNWRSNSMTWGRFDSTRTNKKTFKNGKPPGENMITIELIKNGGSKIEETIHKLGIEMYTLVFKGVDMGTKERIQSPRKIGKTN